MLLPALKQQNYDLIIGIDPDVEKSGVGIIHTIDRQVQLESVTFPDLLDYLYNTKEASKKGNLHVAIVVEAGYLNKPMWHLKPNDSKAVAAAKGNAVGRNHETARKIIEMCRHWELDVHGIKPLKKCWHGKDGKITHEELAYFTNLKQTRTNQDERDALLLAWVFANYPVRVKQLQQNRR